MRRYNVGMVSTQKFIAGLRVLKASGELNVKEVAEASDMHFTHLYQILQGRQQTVSLDAASSIAAACHRTIEDVCAIGEKNLTPCA